MSRWSVFVLVGLGVGWSGTVAAAEGTGRVKGTVVLDGARAGKRPVVAVGIRDSLCPTNEARPVASPTGAVAGAFVRIPVGEARAVRPPTTPIVIEQRGCQYEPAVSGMIRGQKLEVRTADRTVHNVHIWRGEETELNVGQPTGAAPVVRKIDTDAGEVIRLGCDIHPWMSASVVVSDHPFFAVTDAKGAFSIDGLPAGQHTLEVWHPVLGTKETTITITPGKLARAWFVYPPLPAVVAKKKGAK